MGLGGTAKKLKKVSNMAEDLYAKMNEVISSVQSLEEDLERTTEQVDHLDAEVAQQRALLEAIADEQGIDVETVLADLEDGESAESSADADGAAAADSA